MRPAHCACVLFIHCLAWSQNDMIANIDLQFQLSNPGARSLAMAGAFVGLADDATAVLSNPAGMASLSSDMLVFELQSVDRDNDIPFYGGTIRQVGLQDFEYDLQTKSFPEQTFSVPFAAYLNTSSRLKWGVFYAEQARFERQFQTQEIYLPHEADDDRPVNDFTDFYFFPSDNQIDLQIRTVGLSGGISMGEKWSVGLTLMYADFAYKGQTDLILPDIFPSGHPLQDFVGQNFATIAVDGDDQAIGGAVGILFHPNEIFSFGAAYRSQPAYRYDFVVEILDFANNVYEIDDQGQASFESPDSFGAGFAIKPSETLVVSLEVNRVQYAELSDTYHSFFDSGGETQTIDNATEYRIGTELFITRYARPFAVRCGYWFEPYHALQNTYLDNQILYADENGFQQIRNAVFLRQFEQDTDHISFGLGWSLTNHIAFDAAFDWSHIGQISSLSGVYRF